MTLTVCENDGVQFKPRKPTHKFCSNKCRSEYHQHHMPVGDCAGVRKLSNGKVSVTIHFDGSIALAFNVKQRLTVGVSDD